MDSYFSQLILGPQLSGFLKAYPELKVDLITREGLGDLISDGYDLAIRFGEPRPSTLVARRLLDTRVLTVASPGYLKKHGHPTEPQQLVAERHLMIDFRDPETGRPFEWAFRKGRKEIKVENQSQLTLSDVQQCTRCAWQDMESLKFSNSAWTPISRVDDWWPSFRIGRRNASLCMPTIPRANTSHRRRARFLNSYLRQSSLALAQNNSRLIPEGISRSAGSVEI
jgi:DNA-binding transcriptional LysR family regulator